MTSTRLLGDALHALAAQVAAFEALLLTASALHKGMKWRRLHDVVRRFAAVPAWLAPLALAAVAALEIAAAGLLLAPGLRSTGAALAAVVWTAYLLLIVRAIAEGRRDADCGCSFGPAQRLLGWYQLARNGVLLVLAVLVAASSPATAGGDLMGMQLLAAFALLALYGALDQVMALQPLRSGEIS